MQTRFKTDRGRPSCAVLCSKSEESKCRKSKANSKERKHDLPAINVPESIQPKHRMNMGLPNMVKSNINKKTRSNNGFELAVEILQVYNLRSTRRSPVGWRTSQTLQSQHQ